MAIIRPAEPRMGELTDERLETYMTLHRFWSVGLGALLLCNVDPLMEHPKLTDVASFLDRPISGFKLLKLIDSKSPIARHIIERWQATEEHALHLKVPAEEFLSWARAQDLPGIDALLKRAYPTNEKGTPVPAVVRNRIMEYPFRGEMASAIVLAIRKALDPTSYHSVWEELLKLAELKVDPLLGTSETGVARKIRFRNSTGGTNVYEKNAFEKRLGRAVKAAQSPTRPHKAP